jgi:TPR repeat protein
MLHIRQNIATMKKQVKNSFKGPAPASAVKWYRKAADLGDVEARYWLGLPADAANAPDDPAEAVEILKIM